ncbi:YpoC family protein [Metabacillus fastidiosus]|uniref:YpoC family protein n=1 Tax=Metabacillus fastidiosus TaxID=1458 RepID=UPI002E20D573|nr:hypothetical protein [Metabacillus fastidiosus]
MLNDNRLYNVPSCYQHEPFFLASATFPFTKQIDASDVLYIITEEPLFYDIQNSVKKPNIMKPWEEKFEYIPVILNGWINVRNVLREKFKDRNINEHKDLVRKSITYFIISLHWLNDVPVQSLENINKTIEEFQLKPINCAERFLFILKRPMQYHSFIQLEQLFTELEKLFYKELAMIRKRKGD